jgi:hypothetical protein
MYLRSVAASNEALNKIEFKKNTLEKQFVENAVN